MTQGERNAQNTLRRIVSVGLRSLSLLLATGIIPITACGARLASPIVLSGRGAAVRIGTADPISGLELIGPIEGVHGHDCGLYGSPGDYENALNALRNRAAAVGAVYVKILTADEPRLVSRDCFDNRFVIRGLAYGPAREAPTSGGAAVVVTAEGACLPICSPGYACQNGACMPLCNPPCSPGYACAMDRTCQPAP